MAPGRDLKVDTLRGIACILLVTMHVIGHNASAGIHVADDSAYRWYSDAFTYLRMPLFSFLSGLVYAWRPLETPQAYPGFMGKKVRRLLVPYVFFVAAIGVAQSVVPGANNPTDLNPFEWFIYSLSPYWFLLATFWIFAVVALLDSYGMKDRPLFYAIFALVLVIVNVTFDMSSFEFLQLGNAVSLGTFFVVGMLSYRLRILSLSGWKAAITFLIFGVSFCAVIAPLVLDPDQPVGARTTLLGILVGASFPIAFLNLGVSFRPLAWVGAYSSGIFLLHPFLVSGTRVLLSKAGITNTLAEFIIGSVAGVLGSIGVILLLRRFAAGRLILGERVSRAPARRRSTAP